MKLTSVAFLAAAAISSTSVYAAGDSCKKISALAGQAMAARQSGELLEDSLDKIGDGSKFAQGVILKAYEKSVMVAESMKKDAVKEFQNDAFRACLNANS